VDPIDGTTNFAHGLALFCTSIALEIDGEVAVGAIYDPMADELFTVERGQGARLNGRRLVVSAADQLINALMVTGFPPNTSPDEREEQLAIFTAMMAKARAVRRLGSAALDLCFVAAGRFDAFWEQNLYAWDVAAGGLLVEEAGGRVSNYSGTSYSPFDRQIIASNGLLHPLVVDVIGGLRR
jgi:myo-inositol-1(or 4)-monophosphatase